MTETPSIFNKKNLRLSRMLFGFFTLFCLLLILRNSDTAVEYMSRGLLLCARTVVPSLFPFMVLSELLLTGGFATAIFRGWTRPLQAVFHLSPMGCAALLPGLLCGFPIGARCAVLALERGEITKEECERVVAVSGIPSSAFLISAVGGSLWGNRDFGIALYFTVLSSALITAILFGIFWRQAPLAQKRTLTPVSLGGAALLTSSIRSATQSILPICAYVVFFSTLTGTLSTLPLIDRLPAEWYAIGTSFLELSSGMSVTSALSNVKFAACLSAAAAGWSGLSVHCQVMAVCDGHGLSYRPYFIAKALQALLSLGLFALVLRLFPSLLIPAEGCMTAGWEYLF